MIYFLVYLFLEVMITSKTVSLIGGGWLFVEILMSAMAGIAVLFNFRSTLILNMMELKERRLDANGFYQRNLLALLGAILLILPGILSDIIGLCIQIYLLGSLIVSQFMPKYPQQNPPKNQTYSKDDNVIDAEIISDSPTLR
jgi:UPF0716 family protein affecting phage T7 exclusion